MVQDLIAKRNNILSSLKQMYSDLESVNKDIDSEVTKNNEMIANLTAEVNSLNSLKSTNNASIKNLGKIIGK